MINFKNAITFFIVFHSIALTKKHTDTQAFRHQRQMLLKSNENYVRRIFFKFPMCVCAVCTHKTAKHESQLTVLKIPSST